MKIARVVIEIKFDEDTIELETYAEIQEGDILDEMEHRIVATLEKRLREAIEIPELNMRKH